MHIFHIHSPRTPRTSAAADIDNAQASSSSSQSQQPSLITPRQVPPNENRKAQPLRKRSKPKRRGNLFHIFGHHNRHTATARNNGIFQSSDTLTEYVDSDTEELVESDADSDSDDEPMNTEDIELLRRLDDRKPIEASNDSLRRRSSGSTVVRSTPIGISGNVITRPKPGSAIGTLTRRDKGKERATPPRRKACTRGDIFQQKQPLVDEVETGEDGKPSPSPQRRDSTSKLTDKGSSPNAIELPPVGWKLPVAPVDKYKPVPPPRIHVNKPENVLAEEAHDSNDGGVQKHTTRKVEESNQTDSEGRIEHVTQITTTTTTTFMHEGQEFSHEVVQIERFITRSVKPKLNGKSSPPMLSKQRKSSPPIQEATKVIKTHTINM